MKIFLHLFCGITFFNCVYIQAQDSWKWPEKTYNLQQLPKEWSGEQLKPVMEGFTRSLGVDCDHCHVGEKGAQRSTYNFISDDNPNKNRAREMLRMLKTIGGHLEKIEPSGNPVNMWCHTCHRGRPRPMTIVEELKESYQEKGIEEALEHYSFLREEYFGKGAYNFNRYQELNEFGYMLLAKEDFSSAYKIFEVNTKLFPHEGEAWAGYAEANWDGGNHTKAKVYIKKAMKLKPKSSYVIRVKNKMGIKE